MASIIPLTAINVVIACSAILGNGMVIFVMTVRRKQFSSFTNRLIRHQSIIDFVSGVLFLTLKICINHSLFENVNKNWRGELLCRFIYSGYFVWASNVASTYNLVMISLERFMATCYPVKHRNHCSFFRIKISMCATWIIGFIEAIVFIVMNHVNDQGRCSPNSHYFHKCWEIDANDCGFTCWVSYSSDSHDICICKNTRHSSTQTGRHGWPASTA